MKVKFSNILHPLIVGVTDLMQINTLICMILLGVSCSRVENKSTLVEIHIDPSKVERAYDLANDLEPYWDLVALEANGECLISEINQIVYANNKYYILDVRTASVLLFDSTGKYISKLNKKGQGPDEYYGIESFVVDGKNLWVFDTNMSQLICYDENYKMLTKVSTRDIIQAQHIERIGKLIYLSTNWNAYKEKNAQLAAYNIESNTLIDLLYVPSKNPNAINISKNSQLAIKGDSCLFIHSFSDTIYQIKNKSIGPRYQFIFKERYEDKPITSIEEVMNPSKQNLIRGVHDIKYLNNKILLSYIDQYSDDQLFITAIYDERENTCQAYSILMYSLLGNIPIYTTPSHINDNNLIVAYEPFSILEDPADCFIADYNDIKNIKDRNKVKELVSTLTENSNPVLLRLKLKK